VADAARHELPELDEAALRVARLTDLAIGRASDLGRERWTRYLAPLPERFRDDPVPGLRSAARRLRSAYGPKDSIRDDLPEDVTEPLLDALDRLVRLLNRLDARRG
jgi:hypothetical protein